jgi:hypothetical protein
MKGILVKEHERVVLTVAVPDVGLAVGVHGERPPILLPL